MKKLTLLLALGCAAALAPLSVHANSYSNLVTPGTTVDSSNPWSSTFIFAGYNPATEVITDLSLAFLLSQPNDPPVTQNAKITVAGQVLPLVDTTFSLSSSLLGGNVSDPSEAALKAAILAGSQSGSVPYKVEAADSGSSFTLLSAKMSITTAPKGVPDSGSTLALLGFVVCGLGWAGRRLAFVS